MTKGKAISTEIRDAALRMHYNGFTNRQIRKCLNISLRLVQRILRQFNKGEPFEDRPRRKQVPRVLNDDCIRVCLY